MSRTDAHTPAWVIQERDGLVCHDHRNGECDIQPVRPMYAYSKQHSKHFYTKSNKCKKNHYYYITCTHTAHDSRPRNIMNLTLYPLQEQKEIGKVHSFEVTDCKTNEKVRDTDFLHVRECCPRGRKYDSPALPQGISVRDSVKKPYYSNNEKYLVHFYFIIVRDDSIPCSCDSDQKRSWDYCEKEVPGHVITKQYDSWGYYSWGSDRIAPPRSSVRQALNKIKNQDWSRIDEDDYYEVDEFDKNCTNIDRYRW